MKMRFARMLSALLIPALMLTMAACSSSEEDLTFQMPVIDMEDLVKRMELYRLDDKGFDNPPDMWNSSEYHTHFAMEYFELTEQDPSRGEKLAYKTSLDHGESLEQTLKSSSSSIGLYLTASSLKETIRSDPSLIKSLGENEMLKETLKFGPDGNYGGFYEAIELCEEFGLPYDRRLFAERLRLDMEKKEYPDLVLRYSDLYMAEKLNQNFGFGLELGQEVYSFYKEYGEEIRKLYGEGELMLYALRDYAAFGKIYGLSMDIPPAEIAQWLENYKAGDGMYDQFYKNGHSDPNATNMAYEMSARYDIPVKLDLGLIDKYYIRRQQSSGWYTDIDEDAESQEDETFYALGILRLLDAPGWRDMLEEYLNAHPDREDRSVYHQTLMQLGGRTVDVDKSVGRIKELCEKLEQPKHQYPYSRYIQQLNLELDLLEKENAELPQALSEDILKAIKNNQHPEDVACTYLRSLVLYRLGEGGKGDFEDISRDLLEMHQDGALDMKDISAAMYISGKCPEVAEMIRGDQRRLTAISRFVTGCQRWMGIFDSNHHNGATTSYQPTYAALLFVNFMDK